MSNLEIKTIDVNQDKSISKEELEGVLSMIEDDEEIKQLADILTENMDEYNFPVFEKALEKHENERTDEDKKILALYEQIQILLETHEYIESGIDDHYELNDGKLFLEGKIVERHGESNIDMHMEVYKEQQDRYDFFHSQMNFLYNVLATLAEIPEVTTMKLVDKHINKKERDSFVQVIHKIADILQNKDQNAFLVYADFSIFNKELESMISEIFDSLLYSPNISGGKKYLFENMRDIFKKMLFAKDASSYTHTKKTVDVNIFSDIQGALGVEARKLLGVEGDMLQQEQFEEYIINFDGLKVSGINYIWKEDGEWNKRLDVGMQNQAVLERYHNIIEAPLLNGDTEKIDTFIKFAQEDRYEAFLKTEFSALGNIYDKKNDEMLSWRESFPKPFRDAFIGYIKNGYKQLQLQIASQAQETAKETKKIFGGIIATEYLKVTKPEIEEGSSSFTTMVEGYATSYLEDGSFAGTELEIYEKRIQDQHTSIEAAVRKSLLDTARISTVYLIRKAIVKSLIHTYSASLLYGGVSGQTVNNMGDLMKFTEGMDLSAKFPNNEVLKAYADSTGIGGTWNLSDAELAKIGTLAKTIAVNIALVYISGGAAGLATKGVMLGASWALRGVNIGKSLLLSQKIALFYRNSRMLGLGTRLAIGTVDVALEGVFFHAAMSSLSAIVNDQTTEEWRKEMSDVKGYAHSIAFMGIMKIFGQPRSLVQRILSKTKLNAGEMQIIRTGIDIPLEVGAMTGTEQVLSVVFGEEVQDITYERLLQTLALVVGLKMAHGSKIFEKGNKIIIERMVPTLKFTIKKSRIHYKTLSGKSFQENFTTKIKDTDVEIPMKNGKPEYIYNNSEINIDNTRNGFLGAMKYLGQQLSGKNRILKTPFTFNTDKKIPGDCDVAIDPHGFQEILPILLKEAKNNTGKSLRELQNGIGNLHIVDTSGPTWVNIENIPQNQARIHALIQNGMIKIGFHYFTNGVGVDVELFSERGKTAFDIIGSGKKNTMIPLDLDGIRINTMTPESYKIYVETLLAEDFSKELNDSKIEKFKVAKRINDYAETLEIIASADNQKGRAWIKHTLTEFIARLFKLGSIDKLFLIDSIKSSSVVKNAGDTEWIDIIERSRLAHKTIEGPGTEQLPSLNEFINKTSLLKKEIKLELQKSSIDQDKLIQLKERIQTEFGKYDYRGEKNFHVFNEYYLLSEIYAKKIDEAVKSNTSKKNNNKNVNDSDSFVEEISKNAVLEDRPRLTKATELLGITLTPEQEQAILDAHNQDGIIYNLNLSEIRARVGILTKAGFTSEQIRVLMENGICGMGEIIKLDNNDSNIVNKSEKVKDLQNKDDYSVYNEFIQYSYEHLLFADRLLDPMLINSLPESLRTKEVFAKIISNSSKFQNSINSEIYGDEIAVVGSKNQHGKERAEDSGEEILLQKVIDAGIDPNYVLVFRRTQNMDQNKPEIYRTTDFFETKNGLQKEISGESRDNSVIFVSSLAEIAKDSKIFRDRNDDQGLSIRRVNEGGFDKSRNLFSIKNAQKTIDESFLNVKYPNDSNSLVEEISKNAQLKDGPRLTKATELLGITLTPEQEQAILEAHNQDGTMYNLTYTQIRARVEILSKAGFTSEQIRMLMENGICGMGETFLLGEKVIFTRSNGERIAGKVISFEKAKLELGETQVNILQENIKQAGDGYVLVKYVIDGQNYYKVLDKNSYIGLSTSKFINDNDINGSFVEIKVGEYMFIKNGFGKLMVKINGILENCEIVERDGKKYIKTENKEIEIKTIKIENNDKNYESGKENYEGNSAYQNFFNQGYFDGKIPDGYIDYFSAGGKNKGNGILEYGGGLIVVDRSVDKKLNNMILDVSKFSSLPDKQKLEKLGEYIFNKSEKGSSEKAVLKKERELAEKNKGKIIFLGNQIESGGAVCRDRSLLFSILGESLGLKVRMVGGYINGGGHAWNEVFLGNEKYIVDTTAPITKNPFNPVNIFKYMVGNNGYQKFFFKQSEIHDGRFYSDHKNKNKILYEGENDTPIYGK